MFNHPKMSAERLAIRFKVFQKSALCIVFFEDEGFNASELIKDKSLSLEWTCMGRNCENF